jgi:hypothetical protein
VKRGRSVIIPDSVRGLQIVGSTPRGHREVARLRCRAASGSGGCGSAGNWRQRTLRTHRLGGVGISMARQSRPETTSSSHRRPRAMALTRRARRNPDLARERTRKLRRFRSLKTFAVSQACFTKRRTPLHGTAESTTADVRGRCAVDRAVRKHLKIPFPAIGLEREVSRQAWTPRPGRTRDHESPSGHRIRTTEGFP